MVNLLFEIVAAADVRIQNYVLRRVSLFFELTLQNLNKNEAGDRIYIWYQI